MEGCWRTHTVHAYMHVHEDKHTWKTKTTAALIQYNGRWSCVCLIPCSFSETKRQQLLLRQVAVFRTHPHAISTYVSHDGGVGVTFSCAAGALHGEVDGRASPVEKNDPPTETHRSRSPSVPIKCHSSVGYEHSAFCHLEENNLHLHMAEWIKLPGPTSLQNTGFTL